MSVLYVEVETRPLLSGEIHPSTSNPFVMKQRIAVHYHHFTTVKVFQSLRYGFLTPATV